jgi:hypothetical protein
MHASCLSRAFNLVYTLINSSCYPALKGRKFPGFFLMEATWVNYFLLDFKSNNDLKTIFFEYK